MVLVEVIAQSLEDCINAEKAGADRIELVSSLALGGLTPPLGLLIEAKKQVSIPIVPMLRPRGAGCHYTDEELQVMMSNAKLFLEEQADGIVFGALNEDGSINKNFTEQMVNLCHQYNKDAIFHRAFDVSNSLDNLQVLIDLKVDRLLTSGLHDSAEAGMNEISELVKLAKDDIQILAGAGISKDNVTDIIENIGVSEVHFSGKVARVDKTTTNNPNYSMGYDQKNEESYESLSLEKCKELIDLIQSQYSKS